jgi:hypothetical protein
MPNEEEGIGRSRSWRLEFKFGKEVRSFDVCLDRTEPGAEAIKVYEKRMRAFVERHKKYSPPT